MHPLQGGNCFWNQLYIFGVSMVNQSINQIYFQMQKKEKKESIVDEEWLATLLFQWQMQLQQQSVEYGPTGNECESLNDLTKYRKMTH